MKRSLIALIGVSMLVSLSWAQTRWAGNGNFYELIPTWRTWQAANLNAQSRTFLGVSGHLLTITSQAEQSFIVQEYGEPLREASLGGFRGTSGWEWVTGEDWNYTNWAPGEPNGADFLAFHGGNALGTWNDRPNSDMRHYFVEYSVGLLDVGPDAFQVTRGVRIFGTIEALRVSDDQYMIIESRESRKRSDPAAQLVIEGKARGNTIRVAGVLVEASVTSPNVRQRLELFDYVANQWVTLDERTATQNDSEASAYTAVDAGRFVQPGTRKIAGRLNWFDQGAPIPNWLARVDRAVLLLATD